MGVLECGRIKCENIMCHKLILGHKMYICDECWQELLLYKQTWPNEMTVRNVRTRIEEFMDEHPPGTFVSITNQDEINEEFKRLTNSK